MQEAPILWELPVEQRLRENSRLTFDLIDQVRDQRQGAASAATAAFALFTAAATAAADKATD